MKIVIATHNKDKFKEIYKSFNIKGIDLLSLDEFPQIKEIIEDGKTLEENALIKARTVHKITSLPAIADDTGLEVDALGGNPGLYTARYAGENCTYIDNINKMLDKMKDIPIPKRTASFKTFMAYVDNNMEHTACGVVKGMITEEKKGLAGFGYDPIFYVIEKGKTFSEMSIDNKNIISHRGRAIRVLKADIASYLNTQIIKENA